MSVAIASPPRRPPDRPPGETRIVIQGVSWPMYETFVNMLPEGSPVRVAFDGKDMEIMVTGPLHDDYADLLDQFVKTVASELGIRIKPLRQTTWKRPEIARGIESDNCYYFDQTKIAQALAARNARSNDVKDYPNPDMAIEVDISPPQADRSSIYAAMKVEELWRFDGFTLTIQRLDSDGHYQAVDRSGYLPIRADQVDRWLIDEDSSDYGAWTRRLQEWAKTEQRKG